MAARAEIKFFNMGDDQDRRARRCARCVTAWPARRVSRSGARTRSSDEIRAAILEAGKEFGLVQVGSRAYAVEHARVRLDSLAAARRLHRRQDEGVPRVAAGDGYEGIASLGGSYVSKNIEDYYVTPHEMGYGSFVKFDHDFIGREALEKMKDRRTARR